MIKFARDTDLEVSGAGEASERAAGLADEMNGAVAVLGGDRSATADVIEVIIVREVQKRVVQAARRLWNQWICEVIALLTTVS